MMQSLLLVTYLSVRRKQTSTIIKGVLRKLSLQPESPGKWFTEVLALDLEEHDDLLIQHTGL